MMQGPTGLETQTLEELARQKGVSRTAVLREALHLYHLVEGRPAAGSKCSIEGKAGLEKVR